MTTLSQGYPMSERPDGINAVQDELIRKNSVEHRLDLIFPGCVITIDTNSPGLLEKLTHYFAEFVSPPVQAPDIRILAIEAAEPDFDLGYRVKQPDPGKTRIKEEFVDFPDGRIVRKRLTGMHFLFGGDKHVAYGPCEANDNQVVNFVNNRYIQHKLNRGYLLGHAAAVSQDGRGIALAGFSGAGKSTLALQLLARGLLFVSNDRLLVRRDGERLEMLGVAKYPRVNPGTVLNNPFLAPVIPPDERVELEQMPAESLWDLEQKYDVFLDKCFGRGRFNLNANMDGLVILNWKRNAQPLEIREVKLEERDDLLGAFKKAVGLFFEPEDGVPAPDLSPSEYLEALNGCPVFEFTGGVQFESATESCLRFLNNGQMTDGV